MTKQDLKAYAWKELGVFREKLMQVIDAFPLEWDERHVYIARQVIQEKPELSVKQVIEKIKIKDAALTGRNWFVNKDQGPCDKGRCE